MLQVCLSNAEEAGGHAACETRCVQMAIKRQAAQGVVMPACDFFS